MRVATMAAIMLIHTAPQLRKKISPRRLEGFAANSDEAEAWLAAKGAEAEGTVGLAAVAVRRCVRPAMACAASER